MHKNEQFLQKLIHRTLDKEIFWQHADSYFAMPKSENPNLYILMHRLDPFENSGKCYFCHNKDKYIYLFFYNDAIQMFLQKNSDSRVLQMRNVDRSSLYRLYNAVRSSEETDDEQLDTIIDTFFD